MLLCVNAADSHRAKNSFTEQTKIPFVVGGYEIHKFDYRFIYVNRCV